MGACATPSSSKDSYAFTCKAKSMIKIIISLILFLGPKTYICFFHDFDFPKSVS